MSECRCVRRCAHVSSATSGERGGWSPGDMIVLHASACRGACGVIAFIVCLWYCDAAGCPCRVRLRRLSSLEWQQRVRWRQLCARRLWMSFGEPSADVSWESTACGTRSCSSSGYSTVIPMVPRVHVTFRNVRARRAICARRDRVEKPRERKLEPRRREGRATRVSESVSSDAVPVRSDNGVDGQPASLCHSADVRTRKLHGGDER